MAKKTLWQRIKSWFRGDDEKKSAPKPRQNRDARNETVSTRTSAPSYNRRALFNSLRDKKAEEEEKRVKNEAFKAKKAETKSIAEAAKKKTPATDPKVEAAKASRERLQKRLDKLKEEQKTFHKETNNKYNTKTGDEEHDRKAYALRHGGYGSASPEVQKHSVKYHPTITSGARGLASGATFGGTELLISRQAKKDKERAEAEKYYQENKNAKAEMAGEIVGSLASFGGTAKATDRLGEKLIEKRAPRAAEKLAETRLIQNAAKKSVAKAVEKGVVKDATKELIEQVGKDKAQKIVRAVGTDIVQNATTGLLYDFNKASAEYEIGSPEWLKEMGKSAAFNAAITGAVAGGSMVTGGKQLVKDAAETVANRANARKSLDSLIGKASIGEARPAQRVAPRIGESIEDRIARVNAARADDVAENVARNADDVATTSAREVADVADNEAAERLAQIEREMDDAHRVAGDVNATPEERQAAADRFAELNNERERMTSNAPREDGFPYQTTDDEFPVDDINQTRLNDTRAEAETRARQVMEEEPIGEETSVFREAAEQTSEAASEEVTEGTKEARRAWAKQHGEEFTKDGKAPDFDTRWDASMRYEKSQGTSAERKLSRAAKSQFNAIDDEAQEKILTDLINNSDAMEYDVIHHREMYEKAAKDLADDYDRWVDKLNDIAEGGDWSGKEATDLLAKAQYVSAVIDASKNPESAALADVAFRVQKTLSSVSGQTLNMRRQFVHLSESAKIDNTIDDLVSILDPAIGFNQKHRQALQGLNKFEREHYIKGQLMADPKIKECVKKVVNAKTEDAVSEAYTELIYEFNKHNPKSGFDIVQELRYLNMLGNPKTHIRNVFGSAFFSPMRQISNAIRAGIEDSIAKNAGLEVTKHGGLSWSAVKDAWAKNPTSEAGKAALESFDKNRRTILGSAKYETPKYTGRGKTFVGKGIDMLSDFNSNLLAKEDDFFRSRAYRENYIKSYNRYLKDGKPITDKVKKQIEAEALRESQIATFNEYNEFAKFLNNIERKASDANASTLAKWGGRGVNAVMPFTKVPANLMKQSINYSPLGIAKGMLNIKNAAKVGDAVKLNTAIDELASGLTGSSIFGLGMLLGKTTDMFTTNTGKNDPAAKFKKDRGMQNYSVTFKDPETGKGYSFTLDWLVPASATFFSGVEMANQLKKGDFNILDIGGNWSDVVTRLAEPVMETSMLSGLHGMLETMRNGSNDDDTKSAIGVLLRETVQSYMNSLLPTALGQAARTAYKTDMQIAGDTDWEYWRNQMKSKAGLANTNILGEPLGADTDAYGNVKGEKNSTEDYIKSGLKNFLSPSNIQKVDFSEVDNEKLRTYEEAIKDGKDPQDMAYLFPKKQYKKKFSVGGEDVKMTNRELSTYNQAKTTGGQEGMRYILENYMFNHQELDSKGKKVPSADAYTKAEKERLIKQFEGKSMREVEEWLYAQPEFKNATDAERKKAIKGLWDLSKDTKTVASQRVGEQAVWKAQGKDVNEYNFKNEITEKKRDALQPYVDAGIISYEEAVDFARNAGKTYYSETDDGGSASTYYNKKEMIEYLVKKGYSYEKAEALYNSFKNPRAKDYSGNNLSSGRRGYRRRGYGGYRHYGGGSRSKKVPALKQSSYKATKRTYKDTAATLKTSSSRSKGLSTSPVKVEPPKVKFKKYEV